MMIPKKTEKECIEGNRKWFYEVMREDHFNFKISAYRNRFKEMLLTCRREPNIASMAFTNIKLTSGGKSASRDYWIIEKASIASEIIKRVNPDTVFILSEIFNSIIPDNAVIEADVKYKDKKPLRKAVVNGITYYEIYHPSYRRKICL